MLFLLLLDLLIKSLGLSIHVNVDLFQFLDLQKAGSEFSLQNLLLQCKLLFESLRILRFFEGLSAK